MQQPPLADFDLTPPPPGWPPAARWAAGCGIGCAGLVLVQAFFVWGVLALTFNVPRGLVTEVKTPPSATVGQPFPLAVVVRNEGQGNLTVTNVGAAQALLKDLELRNPRPPAVAGPISVMGRTTWSYQQSVPPGQTWEVRFEAVPRRAGTIEGSLDLQVNFAQVDADVKVEAREPASPRRRPALR